MILFRTPVLLWSAFWLFNLSLGLIQHVSLILDFYFQLLLESTTLQVISFPYGFFFMLLPCVPSYCMLSEANLGDDQLTSLYCRQFIGKRLSPSKYDWMNWRMILILITGDLPLTTFKLVWSFLYKCTFTFPDGTFWRHFLKKIFKLSGRKVCLHFSCIFRYRHKSFPFTVAL